jgi:hypothetical protein
MEVFLSKRSGEIQTPLSLRVDTDPDPNFHFDADPNRHSNDADPHVDTTQVLHMLEYQFFLLLVAAFPVYNALPSLSMSKMSQFPLFCTAY